MNNDTIFYVMLLPLTVTISPQRQQYRLKLSNFVQIFELYKNVRFLSVKSNFVLIFQICPYCPTLSNCENNEILSSK